MILINKLFLGLFNNKIQTKVTIQRTRLNSYNKTKMTLFC